MPGHVNKPSRGPMIHIRLDETTHRKLKIRAAHEGITIQHLVADQICRLFDDSEKSNKTK